MTINVDKATPNITWANPADITYGTALSATQLNAAAAWTVGGVNGPVAGSFTYTPAAGTVLNAGTGQTLSVTFTPTDTTDYTTASDSVTINVAKATPTITWANPADITYGTALSATQLNAAAAWTVGGVKGAVAGSFTYTPAAGTVLNAGAGQTLSVTFTPTDTTNYNITSHSVTINVAKATPIITWANPADIIYGTALSATQLDATIVMDRGRRQGKCRGDVHLHSGRGHGPGRRHGQTLSVAFTPSDSTDYNPATATATSDGCAQRRPRDHPVHGRPEDGPDRRRSDLHDRRHQQRSVPGHGSHGHQPAGRRRELCHRLGNRHSRGDRQSSGVECRGQPGHAGPGRLGHRDLHGDSQPDRNPDRLGQRDVERDRYRPVEQRGHRVDHRGRSGGNHRVQQYRLRWCRRTPARPRSP